MNLKKLDGSFNITVNGMPYNTIEGDKYFNDTLSLFNSNPELFELEVPVIIPPKTLEELKAEKIVELKNNKENYKIDNGYSNDYIVQNMLFGLGTYSEEERNGCKLFMNGLINKYDLKKEDIKNATLETIASKSTTFEE